MQFEILKQEHQNQLVHYNTLMLLFFEYFQKSQHLNYF